MTEKVFKGSRLAIIHLTYLGFNFRDQEGGVAQRNPALHSAGLLCVRLSYGRRMAYIFDFCLRAISFQGLMNGFSSGFEKSKFFKLGGNVGQLSIGWEDGMDMMSLASWEGCNDGMLMDGRSFVDGCCTM